MGHEVTLGGERLGGGKRNKVHLKSYERSTHDLSYVWRSTMASGTLVPFMSELALPGDTFDIELDIDVLTHPTIGPLFGTYKIHLDVFQAPIRLYQGALHMNMLGIGNDMSKILLPQIQIPSQQPDTSKPIDNQQMNPSALLKYLGISGMGNAPGGGGIATRNFNAVPYLAYWEIYKNYYANKQENIGAVIHTNPQPINPALTGAVLNNSNPGGAIPVGAAAAVYTNQYLNSDSNIVLTFTAGQLTADYQVNQINIWITNSGGQIQVKGNKVFRTWTIIPSQNIVIGEDPNYDGADWPGWTAHNITIGKITSTNTNNNFQGAPKITTFPLDNIDTMRKNLLLQNMAAAYVITDALNLPPYNLPLQSYTIAVGPPAVKSYANLYSQEGLALRTYASDLFNNWINTAWIDDPVTGITAVTSVNVVGNKFTIDELNLSKKVYEMLNRIAISGGSYDDWLDAVYTEDRNRSAESPIYLGGMLAQLQFQEVISNSATEEQPLGTLAGRGKMGGQTKGGKIIVKIDEPSYIIGIVSLVPNIDYSQGNKWDMNLRTLNDLHKPALDEIGFQNLNTDQMAWWDTLINTPTNMTYRSAGKQPAWINYMTNVNKVYGNFADEAQQMFMVLNRRYDMYWTAGFTRIQDLTTYIDPTKFNHIFADTRLDAQNFWTQIAVGIEARRKMSAKVMPNL